MMSRSTLFLEWMPYLRDLDADDRALSERSIQRRDLTAGETIMLEGEPAEALYVVQRGRVRIFRASTEGREQVLFVVGPGGTFNDVGTLDGGVNLASAQAIDPEGSIWVLPAHALRQLIATNPRLAASAAAVLASRVRELATLIEDLSLRPATQRVAHLLLAEGRATGEVVLSREEIATRTGTVREVVSRSLRRLAQAGAVARVSRFSLHVNTAVLGDLLRSAPGVADPDGGLGIAGTVLSDAPQDACCRHFRQRSVEK